MKVGTILLTKSNFYCNVNGDLPKRPKHDKILLDGLLSVCVQNVSKEGYLMLPPSMQSKCISIDTLEPTFPVTIKEIAQSDLLIVSRSQEELAVGKVFRLNNFKLLVKDRKVELWVRK